MNLGAYENQDENLCLDRFESMLKTDKVLFFDADEFERIINHYLDYGDFSMAKKALEVGIEQHPTNIALQLLKTEMLIFDDEIVQAEEILNKIHEIEPYNEEVYIQRASIYSMKNQHKEAIKVLSEALFYNNDSFDLYDLLAIEYVYLDDYENALKNYKKCLLIDKEDEYAFSNIIFCYLMLSQESKAIQFLEEFIDNDPYNKLAWLKLGKIQRELGNNTSAIKSFSYAIAIDEYFLAAYIERAKTLEEIAKYEEAIKDYKVTLGMDDPTAFAYYRIGRCYQKLNQEKECLFFYEKSIEEDPSQEKSWLRIIDFYIYKKSYQKALYYTHRAIEVDDTNAKFWMRYEQIGKLTQKKDLVTRKNLSLSKLNNSYLDTYISRVDLLIVLENYTEALDILKEVNLLFPDSAEVNFRMAGIYFYLNNTSLAAHYLSISLEIDKEYINLMQDLFPNLFNGLINKFLDKLDFNNHS